MKGSVSSCLRMRNFTSSNRVKYYAILSRLTILFLQVISNWLMVDHDADAFVSPSNPDYSTKFGDTLVNSILGGFIRWDAQYFIHIAEYGYTHENALAFFPLYPMLLRCIGTLLHFPLQLFLNFHSCLLLGSILFNFCLFVKSCLLFYQLSLLVTKSESLSIKATLLFCYNPASIFFSAPYSETLYCFLLLSSLVALESHRTALPTIGFFLASFSRSNALVNVGFLLYSKCKECLIYFNKIRHATTEYGHLSLIVVLILSLNYTLIPLGASCLLTVFPFGIFQYWCYMVYCDENIDKPLPLPHVELFIRTNFFHAPHLGQAEWCYNAIPIAYSHIQHKYWEVGAFQYYELKQLPNFLLALPIVTMVICHTALYLVDNLQVCLRCGIPPVNSSANEDSLAVWQREGINSRKVFVYTVHALALCIFCVVCIHVQVTTRLLCSSAPVIYWFAASLMEVSSFSRQASPKVNSSNTNTHKGSSESLPNSFFKISHLSLLSEYPSEFWGRVVFVYFHLYFMVGTILFSNFLPWT